VPAEGSHGVCDACASALGDVQGLVTGCDPGARVRRPGSGAVPTTRTVHDRTPPGRIARAPVRGDAAIR
jgi:hypothetical protein